MQLETQCERRRVTMNTFMDWMSGKDASDLSHFSRQDYWGYSDYNHIQEKFADNTQLHEVSIGDCYRLQYCNIYNCYVIAHKMMTISVCK